MPAEPPRAQEIFLAAAELADPAARSAYLDRTCGADSALRARVEALLRAHDQPDSLLDAPLAPAPQGPGPGEGPTCTHGDAAEDQAGALALLAPPGRPDSLGQLGHYEVLEVLGRGGFGVVFRAFDEVLQRVVAVKALAPSLAVTSPARKRFLREARASAPIQHENVVRVHEVGEQPLPYLVMEFIPGETLQQLIDRTGPLEAADVLRIGRQVADGLAAAHAQGLIHRDIKPSNILIDSGPRRHVKITDFGLARAADDASLTRSGVVAGTPMYMAPEQARGEALDHRADLFSLGSVLYTTLTGRPPFRAETTLAVLKRVAEDTPRPIQEVIPEVPDWLCRIVEKLHAKDPADRFQTAREVADVLADCEEQLKAHGGVKGFARLPAGRPATRARRLLRPWVLLPVATVLLAALVGLYVLEVAHVSRDEGRLVVPPEKGLQADRPSPTVRKAPFVVLARGGQPERSFTTLAESIASAADGDTVEVHGDGPFLTDPIKIKDRGLAIRAAAGCRPVVAMSAEGLEGKEPLLATDSPLVLEGLELQRLGGRPTSEDPSILAVLVTSGRALRLAHCRLLLNRRQEPQFGLHCINTSGAPVCELRGCEVLATGGAAMTLSGGEVTVENSVVAGEYGMLLFHSVTDPQHIDVTLRHNTLRNRHAVQWNLRGSGERRGNLSTICQVLAANNVFTGNVCFNQEGRTLGGKDYLPADAAEALLPRFVGWREDRNLYPGDTGLLQLSGDCKKLPGGRELRTLAEWQQLWSLKPAGSLLGRARFRGGDVAHKAYHTPRQVAPQDFRLSAGSPGQGAGPEGKDLGADVDLVGPAAYERFRQAPAYQEWLKRIGRAKADGLAARPFVLLGGEGEAERRFATLAEALPSAADGDTIEIRGDGPFVTGPVDLGKRSLTLKAGPGARPVLRLSREAGNAVLLRARGPLVLEGLELQRLGGDGPRKQTEDARALVDAGGGRLSVANCRFLMRSCWGAIFARDVLTVDVRNCEFVGTDFTTGVEWVLPENGKATVENCVMAGGWHGLVLQRDRPEGDTPKASVRLAYNTLALQACIALYASALPKESEKPARWALDLERNVFDGGLSGLYFLYWPAVLKGQELTGAEAETSLSRAFSWRERGNLYGSEMSLLTLNTTKAGPQPGSPKSVEDWKRFWKLDEPSLLRGSVHYRGGDLRARAATAPERLKAADFRLRPDSLGKAAAEGGQDVGADVSLVGPGDAYERWKKSPGYRQWLKAAGK